MPPGKKSVLLIADAVGLDLLEYLLANYNERLNFPNFANLGLGNLLPKFDARIPKKLDSVSYRISQDSYWPDSQVGHRELMGVFDFSSYELFPEGFSSVFKSSLEELIQRDVIYNEMAGGSEAIMKNWKIVRQWKEHHPAGAKYPDKAPVVLYASVCDPLMQIAMPDDQDMPDFIPVEEQASIGEKAFKLANEMGIKVTRVITRPYRLYVKGTDRKIKASFDTQDQYIEIYRTANRVDIVPPIQQRTLLDVLKDKGVYTIGVGKAPDMVDGFERIIKRKEYTAEELETSGFWPTFNPAKDNNPLTALGMMDAFKVAAAREGESFIYATMGDTDSVYGHSMNVEGTLKSLETLDSYLPIFFNQLNEGDLFIVTADHSMKHVHDLVNDRLVHVPDPKFEYGYHNNEPLPLLVYVKGKSGEIYKLGNDHTLAAVGHLIAQAHGVAPEFVKECNLQNYFN